LRLEFRGTWTKRHGIGCGDYTIIKNGINFL
jgi:hypothetical protein